ncbi:class I SAM-dependent methyltransferase [Mariniflexile litorale]|uniref:Class I SAM-dependent methyltransferase n=1 Tax=Mariniflexile litorale TaxID=3045158 RepID=A0AAU7EC01_9FLAO|nr:class I SAM-dependent methyltransferase [Mariniflexile sp. KMM 9835]MDQ8210408.1 class I SAM-dependent methyltransferase [Mariniflexile sp. KMM 9835]
MYRFLKKNIKSLIPKEFLFKNELLLRKFYAVFYLGNKHECNVCNKRLRKFISLESNDLLCPFCGSLSRNRRLWDLLNKDGNIKGKTLHFSPSRSLYRNLKKIKSIDYYSSDFENEFLADYQFDITNINQEPEKFDTIICYHILEHIIDDKKAMTELYRVLKPNGRIYIQTPYKNGDIYEDYSIVSLEDRLKHFGQEDHVRVYSIEGLKSRLENISFNVCIRTFNNTTDGYFGFKSPETVLIATK